MSEALERFHPATAAWFRGAFGAPTAAQVGAWEALATGAHTDSNMNQLRIPGINFSAVASFGLARAAVEAAGDDAHVHTGTVISRDHFYLPARLRILPEHGARFLARTDLLLPGHAEIIGSQDLPSLGLLLPDHVGHLH